MSSILGYDVLCIVTAHVRCQSVSTVQFRH